MKENKGKEEVRKSMSVTMKIIYFVVLGLFALILGFLIFASLQ